MKNHAFLVWASLTGCLTSALGQGLIPPDRLSVCNSQSDRQVANQFCKALSNEFDSKSIQADPNSLQQIGLLYNPATQPVVFAAAFQKQIYGHFVVRSAQTDISNALQTAGNLVAQSLSTKAAINQSGANPDTSGSTTLTQKPTTTDLIALAAESGAFTDTVTGTTLTAKANVNGVRRYLSSKPFASFNPSTADILQHITLSATFNIAQGGSAAAPSTGQATSVTPAGIASVILPSNNVSFSSLSTSWQILRKYTPTNKAFQKEWSSNIGSSQAAITSAASTLDKDVIKAFPDVGKIVQNPTIADALGTWTTAAAADEAKGDFPAFVRDFMTYMDVYIAELEKTSGFDQDFIPVISDISTLTAIRNDILDKARGSLATLTYSYSTPPKEPATHEATLILAYVAKKRNAGAQTTANFAGTWFATIPSAATYGRLKSCQFTAEYDQPIGDRSAPKAVFSVAGYGQYQYTANVLNVTVANVVPGTNISVPANSQVFTSTPGWLGVAQAKMVFNIGKGATIPVAFKWSNKTDLLSDSNWKGQFGLSYDLSALKSILGSK